MIDYSFIIPPEDGCVRLNPLSVKKTLFLVRLF